MPYPTAVNDQITDSGLALVCDPVTGRTYAYAVIALLILLFAREAPRAASDDEGDDKVLSGMSVVGNDRIAGVAAEVRAASPTGSSCPVTRRMGGRPLVIRTLDLGGQDVV